MGDPLPQDASLPRAGEPLRGPWARPAPTPAPTSPAAASTKPPALRVAPSSRPDAAHIAASVELGPASAAAASDLAAAPASPPARAWDDAPAHTKGTLLILVSLTAGLLVGRIEQAIGGSTFFLAAGLGLSAAGLFELGRRWVWAPLELLVRGVEQAGHEDRPADLASLPVHRQDDLGAIARAVHRLATHSLRSHQEAKQLRRTLDQRVAQATRAATHRLRQEALRDPLTELGNRRFLEEQLDPLLASHKSAGEDLACVLIDLDNFKAVNDTLGHGAGDALLTFLAGLIRGCSRKEDHAVRMGGDEFVVLMPGCDARAAARFALQVSALFRQHARTTLPADCQASLSVGVASLEGDGASVGGELIKCADARLYAAKKAGKDRVLT